MVDDSPLGYVFAHSRNVPMRAIKGDVGFQTRARGVEVDRGVELGSGSAGKMNAHLRSAVENDVLDPSRPVVPASDRDGGSAVPWLEHDFVAGSAIEYRAVDRARAPDESVCS